MVAGVALRMQAAALWQMHWTMHCIKYHLCTAIHALIVCSRAGASTPAAMVELQRLPAHRSLSCARLQLVEHAHLAAGRWSYQQTACAAGVLTHGHAGALAGWGPGQAGGGMLG